MKRFTWDHQKNEWLKKNRGISFERIIETMATGGLVDDLENLSKEYVGQRLFIIRLESYLYVVPYRENKDEIFLVTAFPSRKIKKLYGVINESKID